MIDFQITSIIASPIVEIFPYREEDIASPIKKVKPEIEHEPQAIGKIFSASGSDFEDFEEEESDEESELTDEYSDSEEDSDIQQLEDSLFDTGINEDEESEDSEMNEDKILKEISYYQNTTHNLIPRESFKRLCDEVLQDFVADWCFTKDAIDAMQVACEAYMIETFQKSNEIAILGKRQTIQPKDMCFAKRNRTEY
jgi:histone H3/H4